MDGGSFGCGVADCAIGGWRGDAETGDRGGYYDAGGGGKVCIFLKEGRESGEFEGLVF